ncbi:MAG: signal peptidase I, partial [Aridibacter sp.]
PSSDNFKKITVPENEYFLMGDNRPNSMDSRYIGTITRGNINGKVETIISKEDWDKGKRW